MLQQGWQCWMNMVIYCTHWTVLKYLENPWSTFEHYRLHCYDSSGHLGVPAQTLRSEPELLELTTCSSEGLNREFPANSWAQKAASQTQVFLSELSHGWQLFFILRGLLHSGDMFNSHLTWNDTNSSQIKKNPSEQNSWNIYGSELGIDFVMWGSKFAGWPKRCFGIMKS